MSEQWFERPIDLLLDEYARRIDDAYARFVRRLEADGALVAPDFSSIWACFAQWFREPVEGVTASDDLFEFGIGFIDGDPEREDLELTVPRSLRAPLVEVGLARSFAIADPEEAGSTLGLGEAGAVFHFDLIDTWRALPADAGRYWENANPYGWKAIGRRSTADESLTNVESTLAFRLASEAVPLRVELFMSTRPDRTILVDAAG